MIADPLSESWTPKRQYPGYLAGLTTQQPVVIPPRRCEPLSVDHCRGLPYNLTSYPNAVGHNTPKEVYRDLVAYRQLVDSECYPLAAEFVCQLLQPECIEDEMMLPCRDFCEGAFVPSLFLNYFRALSARLFKFSFAISARCG